MESNDESLPVATLHRIGTAEKYKCFKLRKEEVTIGRAKEVDLHIADVSVSRKHGVFRFDQSNNRWTVECQGMNGIMLNNVEITKNKEIPLTHMDTIEFGVGTSKFVYTFRVMPTESSEEPQAKKMRAPLASHNCPSSKESPQAYQEWWQSKKLLKLSLVEEQTMIDSKLEQQNSIISNLLEQQKVNQHSERVKKKMEEKFAEEKKLLEDKVSRGEMEKNQLQKEKELLEQRMSTSLRTFQEECDRKMVELETGLTLANIEKQALLEQKELVVQQLIREKQILQESLEEQRRMQARTQGELLRCIESHQASEQQWNDERKRFEVEKKQLQDNGSADESQLRRMKEELDACKTLLDAKEREFEDMQSRASIGLELYDAIQVLQQGTSNQDGQNLIRIAEGATFQTPVASTSQPIAAEQELAQVREELRLAKEKIEQASTIARNEILVKMESVMEKQLECGICSEMIVFAISLNCMHTFCHYCINMWKKNKMECPICRAAIQSEGRNCVIDSTIDAMISSLSEETQKRRKDLVEQRQELFNAAQQAPAPTTYERGQAFVAAQRARGRPRRPEPVQRPAESLRHIVVPALPAPIRPVILPPQNVDVAMSYAQARSRFLVTQQVRHAMHPVFPVTMRPPQQQVQRAHQGIFVQQQQQPLLAPQTRSASGDVVLLSDHEEPTFNGLSNESVMIVEERTTRGYRRRRAV